MKKVNLKLYAKISLISIVLGMVIFSSGCNAKSRGKIIVDSPEVFTRERLVRQRLREKNWLEKKLDKDEYQFGYQGYRDVRIFTGIVAGLRGKYDPMGGELTAERIKLDTADTKRRGELAELQHRLNKLKLEQQIANLEAGNEVNLDSTETTGQGDSIASSDSDFYEIEAPYKNENLPSLPDPQKIQTTEADLTGIEKLRDEKAYRDAVNAMLRETVLDDTHDLNGNTIYTFKFDITVLPDSQKNKALGNVHLKLKNKQLSDTEYESLYQQWRDIFDRDLRREALNLQKRFQLGFLTEPEKEKLALDAENFKVEAKEKILEGINLDESIEALSDRSNSYIHRFGSDKSKKKRLNKTICSIVNNRYHALRDVLTFLPLLSSKGKIYYYAGIDTKKLRFNDTKMLKVQMMRLKSKLGDSYKDLAFEYDKEKEDPKIWRNDRFEEILKSHTPWDCEKDEGEKKKYEFELITISREFWIKTLESNIRELEDKIKDDKILKLMETIEHEITTLEVQIEYLDKQIKNLDKKKKEKEQKKEKQRQLKELRRYYHNMLNDVRRQNGFRNFVAAIKRLEKINKPYIYTIEPKEYAQNISDVAAVEKLKNLVLSLKAIVPIPGVDADGYLNKMKRSQSLLHAIKRKPLVVGYIDGKSDFGWILGPRFEINDDGEVDYRHTHVQYSVQSSIVVPSWNKGVKLKGKYSWDNKKAVQCLFDGKDLEIKLPGDFSALTNALLHINGGRPQEPYIDPNQNTPQIILQAGRQEHILIRGKKLWRNPEVYIGSQKDNGVEVLPDMRGILATFDKVITPAKKGSGDTKVDLTVVTSEGISRLPQAVTILPEARKLETFAVKIISPKTHENGPLVLLATSSQLPQEPKGYMFKMRIKVKGTKNWIDIGTPQKPKVVGKEVKLTFPKIQYDGKNTEMAADLQFKLRPTDDYISIPSLGGAGSFIFFKDPNDFKLFIEKKNRTITCGTSGNRKRLNQDIVFNLVDPKLFFKGIPGAEALKKGFKLHLETESNGRKSSDVMVLRGDQVEFSEDDKGTVTINAGKLFSKVKEENSTINWIFDQVTSTSQKEKVFKLRVTLPNGKHIEFRDDSKLKIKYENK